MNANLVSPLSDTNRQHVSRIAQEYGPCFPLTCFVEINGITSLNLHSNEITSLSIEAQDASKEKLESLKGLRHLDLSSNLLGSIDGKKIRGVSILPYLVNLESINLAANNLTSSSLVHLFHVQDKVQSFPNLKRLCLSHNRIETIPKNLHEILPSLEDLDLKGNTISKLKDLISALEPCRTFKSFVLQDVDGSSPNPVCKRKAYRTTILANLTSLEYLDGNRIDEEERNEARDTFESNKDISTSSVTRRNYSTEGSHRKHLKVEKDGFSRQEKIERAMNRESVYKMNRIEDEVKRLSYLVQSQANEYTLSQSFETDEEVKSMEIETIDAEVQTMPQDDRISASDKHLHLQLSLYKMQCNSVREQLMREEKEAKDITTLLKRKLKMTRKEAASLLQSKLCERDDLILRLQEELRSVLSKQEVEKQRWCKRREIEIRKIANITTSEMESMKTVYLERERQMQKRLNECEECNSKLKVKCKELENEKLEAIKNFEHEKSSIKTRAQQDIGSLMEEKEKYSKMLEELKEAFEVTSQQSATNKVLAAKQKIDYQKAISLLAKQKREIQDKSEQIDFMNRHATDMKQSMEVASTKYQSLSNEVQMQQITIQNLQTKLKESKKVGKQGKELKELKKYTSSIEKENLQLRHNLSSVSTQLKDKSSADSEKIKECQHRKQMYKQEVKKLRLALQEANKMIYEKDIRIDHMKQDYSNLLNELKQERQEIARERESRFGEMEMMIKNADENRSKLEQMRSEKYELERKLKEVEAKLVDAEDMIVHLKKRFHHQTNKMKSAFHSVLEECKDTD
ncbi:hypothetical protein CTEN210_08966 [Chaetoceros tenuissimus]|uniref:Leucine-rich repeat and coiled-coil domain-containing protein 1 n=1 Tax=Chaetoceros tenuissimus TaxID=426638 RepID=A0AAD3H6S1_9STRA|nr:hypothetical protein CTEN210_08966 [Chaetoceros tenuissimus]